MSLFGNSNSNLLSNNSTQSVSNPSTQSDKEKQGQTSSLFGNLSNPQASTTSLFAVSNAPTGSNLFGGSINNSTYNANQTITNASFLNTSNQSNIENKEKIEQANKPLVSGILFGTNTSGSSLFGKTESNPTKTATGSFFTKPAAEKETTQIPSASSNLFSGGFKAPQAQAQTNEEKKEAAQAASTSLFGGTASNESNSIFGSTNLSSGNLFENPKTNESQGAAESKPTSSSGFFGASFGPAGGANTTGSLFGQSKPAVENLQEAKDAKSSGPAAEEKKVDFANSLFGNSIKANEPVKNAESSFSNLFGKAAAANAATSTANDKKSNLFGGECKDQQPSAETKSNLFGGAGFNLGSSGLFGANKHAESNQTQIQSGANFFAAQQPKVPQSGGTVLNQGLFGSVENKNEEKTEVQNNSQTTKPLFCSSQANNVSTNPFTSSNAISQSTPKKSEEAKQTASALGTNQIHSKPAEASATKSQPNILNLYGVKDTKAENKISFGVPTIPSASALAASETNKTIPSFTNEKKETNIINLNKVEKLAIDSSKITIAANTRLASEANKNLPAEISKLSKPSEQVKEVKIEDLKYENLMNRTIDDTINNWKLELETQTEVFNNNAEKIKQFEFSFLKNFDNIQILNNVIEKIETDTKESIENMKTISHQEDNIIDELDLIEKGLDKYLEIVSKRVPQDYVDNNYLYQTSLDLDKEIKMIQNEINNVQKTIVNDNEKIGPPNPNLDKSTSISYENLGANEFIDIDKNDIESILNGYYNSVKVIQTMQNSIKNKIVDIDSDIADFNSRRNYAWN